uniref:Uncharacterized protein n=1 Tax=Arundo donax TaxID=35708 RepID=A0A0A9HGB8_ARUDO
MPSAITTSPSKPSTRLHLRSSWGEPSRRLQSPCWRAKSPKLWISCMHSIPTVAAG